MNAHILPPPVPADRHPDMFDREFLRDDMPPELFDPEEDIEELEAYLHIAESWND